MVFCQHLLSAHLLLRSRVRLEHAGSCIERTGIRVQAGHGGIQTHLPIIAICIDHTLTFSKKFTDALRPLSSEETRCQTICATERLCPLRGFAEGILPIRPAIVMAAVARLPPPFVRNILCECIKIKIIYARRRREVVTRKTPEHELSPCFPILWRVRLYASSLCSQVTLSNSILTLFIKVHCREPLLFLQLLRVGADLSCRSDGCIVLLQEFLRLVVRDGDDRWLGCRVLLPCYAPRGIGYLPGRTRSHPRSIVDLQFRAELLVEKALGSIYIDLGWRRRRRRCRCRWSRCCRGGHGCRIATIGTAVHRGVIPSHIMVLLRSGEEADTNESETRNEER